MPATIVEEGRKLTLDGWLTAVGAQLRVILFTAPTSIDEETELSDLTEADFSGYSRETPSFPASTINGNGNALSAGSTVTFTHSGGGTDNTIVGWALIHEAANLAIGIEPLSAPVTLDTGGQFIDVTPQAYLGQLSPPL